MVSPQVSHFLAQLAQQHGSLSVPLANEVAKAHWQSVDDIPDDFIRRFKAQNARRTP